MMMTLATHEDITRQKASRATLKPKRQMSSHNRLPDVPFGRAVGSFSLVRSTCTSSYPEILWRDLDGKESTSLMPPSLVPSIGFVSSCHRSRNSISRIRSSRFCLSDRLRLRSQSLRQAPDSTARHTISTRIAALQPRESRAARHPLTRSGLLASNGSHGMNSTMLTISVHSGGPLVGCLF
ncbi:hypothetical protein M440DRAFT_208520 [Trichoderma longibrachiatum ATCC 18648]|uniref:Uncharacterized protein n=1 Tax=Trichoderma longibrachiatum ATCC 18648 TaxID=983965 RepID=A0A2T4BR05_TRILO|nr:hypothetical protein M440DRAFT_208520 [Trichoderma longibrachiatum ATCC 18648]